MKQHTEDYKLSAVQYYLHLFTFQMPILYIIIRQCRITEYNKGGFIG
jgi:hypothetical protein